MVHNAQVLPVSYLIASDLVNSASWLHFRRDVMSEHHQKRGGTVISVLIFACLMLMNKTLNLKCYQPNYQIVYTAMVFKVFSILGEQSMFWQIGWLDDMDKLAGEWK